MAIIIPSKNIYEIENSKIRDNAIDNVTVETISVDLKYQYGKSLAYQTPEKTEAQSKSSIDDNGTNYALDYTVETIVSGCKIYDTYNVYNIKFPKVGFDELVKKIKGFDNEKEPPYIQTEANFTLNSSYFYVDKSFQLKEKFTNVSGTSIQKNVGVFDFDKITAYSGQKTTINNKDTFNSLQNPTVKFTADTVLGDDSKLSISWLTPSIEYSPSLDTTLVTSDLQTTLDAGYETKYNGSTSSNIETSKYSTEENFKTITYKEDEEHFIFEGVKVITNRKIYATASIFTPTTLPSGYFDHTILYGSQVVEINLEASDVGFKFLGDTINVEIADAFTTYSTSTSLKPFTLTKNELLQSSATVSDIPLSQYLATSILNNYENGKETAVLLCDIGEYYKEFDGYDFKPNNYYGIKNAIYENGAVKQIDKDWQMAEPLSANITIETDSRVLLNFVDLGISRTLQVWESNFISDDFGTFTQNVNFKLNESLEYNLEISMGSPSGNVIYATIDAGDTQGTAYYFGNIGDEFDSDIFPMAYSIRSATLQLDRIYPKKITRFAFYYGSKEMETWDIDKPQKIEFRFYKRYDVDNVIKFVAIGYNVDTYISYRSSSLKDGVEYKFSLELTNINNGSLSWKDIKIEEVNFDNLAISVKNPNKPMTFKIGDQVIPMIYTVDGTDVPMSLKKDKNPKVFEVVGTRVFFDGAVWQEITLQEKIETY